MISVGKKLDKNAIVVACIDESKGATDAGLKRNGRTGYKLIDDDHQTTAYNITPDEPAVKINRQSKRWKPKTVE